MSSVYPDFGPLAGVRVISCGSALAGPFGPQLMAEWGADVVWVENPKTPDMLRGGTAGLWVEGERRNQRNIALDIVSPEGQAAFLAMVSRAEILVQSSRGGYFDQIGLSDEVLWGVNPALVITHVSGYGQRGKEELVGRSAYDPIAQAFGCYMQLNGRPGAPPTAAMAFPADYYAGLFSLGASLAALTRARATGQGESIDVAMFEVLMRAQGYGHLEYLNLGMKPLRRPEGPLMGVGIGVYPCSDGIDVYFVIVGAGVVQRALTVLGIDDPQMFSPKLTYVDESSPAGIYLQKVLTDFCNAHSAKEVEDCMSSAGVPCSRLYTYDIAENDPHYQARNVFIDWPSVEGKKVRGIKVVPDFVRRPGQIWRGAATVGLDNEAILAEAGLDEEAIADLYAAGVVGKGEMSK